VTWSGAADTEIDPAASTGASETSDGAAGDWAVSLPVTTSADLGVMAALMSGTTGGTPAGTTETPAGGETITGATISNRGAQFGYWDSPDTSSSPVSFGWTSGSNDDKILVALAIREVAAGAPAPRNLGTLGVGT
jgi:hypothetical protein